MPTKRKIVDQSSECVSLNVFDPHGREVGTRILRTTYTYTAIQSLENYSGGYSIDPGTYYAFRPQITRNGKPYGGSQRESHFVSKEECEAAITLYLSGAHKRASQFSPVNRKQEG